ncbi:hypothetical protein A1O3_00960 [Capronia epimyces CBS 606.96]|uniref:Uncharacterized protein n=1 Tax=Capronia epimyces CBS 606.96 TaxID=1182542 RepID=W9ZD32_9EURO|nr:uncharacterized protein A1O3_00960 [Capronia epimyces CBS 606.96]EXJ92409.1 hypothetical protein A1O3_00960 [Capronia epimyces CBS 606.96]
MCQNMIVYEGCRRCKELILGDPKSKIEYCNPYPCSDPTDNPEPEIEEGDELCNNCKLEDAKEYTDTVKRQYPQFMGVDRSHALRKHQARIRELDREAYQELRLRQHYEELRLRRYYEDKAEEKDKDKGKGKAEDKDEDENEGPFDDGGAGSSMGHATASMSRQVVYQDTRTSHPDHGFDVEDEIEEYLNPEYPYRDPETGRNYRLE